MGESSTSGFSASGFSASGSAGSGVASNAASTASKPAPPASWDVIASNAIQISPEGELAERLREFENGGKPLRVKFGADPSAPDLHIGHAVPLRKLRQFQQLGHQIVLIIGDATARIGDPSGRSATRPQLTKEQVDANARTYMDQVFIILNREKTEVRFNSEWLDAMDLSAILRLTSRYTVARMLEREDYKERFRGEIPIYVHEFLYPLMQAYDSVAVEADVEIGGTDQTFNLMVGREIQLRYGVRPQAVLTLPLLVGTDGQRKMSKSLGNYIGLTDSPTEMFGKMMSIPDELMEGYMRLGVWYEEARVRRLTADLKAGRAHPREVKAQMGRDLVALYYDAAAAQAAADEFDRIFKGKGIPDEIETKTVSSGGAGSIGVCRLLVEAGLASSMRAARQLVQGGGVTLDEARVSDPAAVVRAGEHLMKKGSRTFIKIVVQ